MEYYRIQPEVAGGLGKRTVWNRLQKPPRILRLHYEFQDWLGDALLKGYQCHLVTEDLKGELEQARVSGGTYRDLDVSVSEEFLVWNPDGELPRFVWLKVVGVPGVDDLGIDPARILVVSERVLKILRKHGIEHAIVSPFP